MATLDYDPSEGKILLVGDHATLEYDGCGPDLQFSRQGEDGEPLLAFWISQDEAVVLGKMMRYCLDKLPNISPHSREVLEALDERIKPLAQGEGAGG